MRKEASEGSSAGWFGEEVALVFRDLTEKVSLERDILFKYQIGAKITFSQLNEGPLVKRSRVRPKF